MTSRSSGSAARIAGAAIAALVAMPILVLTFGAPVWAALLGACAAVAAAALWRAPHGAPALGRGHPALQAALADALPALERLDAVAPEIEAFSIRLETDSIIATGRRIVEEVRRAPGRLHSVQRLLSYYLPRAADLIGAYRALEAARAYPDRRAEIEALIPRLGDAFRSYAARLDEEDLRLLDIEVQLLNESLKEEGLDRSSR